MADKHETIAWEGPEYIAPQRGTWWYVLFGLVTIGLLVLTIWLQQWILLVLVLVVAMALIQRALMKPKMIKYSLSSEGLIEGQKKYTISSFKAFGVVKRDNYFYLSLRPASRFGMRMNIVIPGDKGEEIVDFFGARMPMEEVNDDFFDKLVRWLKI